MGSVKDLMTDPLSYEGGFYRRAGPHTMGFGAWKVSGRFSVGDLKDLIPPIEIKNKNFALAMQAAAYFEHAAKHGIPNCYRGMLRKGGGTTSVDDLVKRGELSDTVLMDLANVPSGNLASFHEQTRSGKITNYVADVESIFRFGIPLGSSILKKVFELSGRSDVYEKLATYDETAQELDKIRKEVDQYPQLKAFLENLGLTQVPHPGTMFAKPTFDYTTKFNPKGDIFTTAEDVRKLHNLDEETYEAWQDLLSRTAYDQKAYCRERGVVNIDGKGEVVFADGRVSLGDFACTIDENRLMLPYDVNGVRYLLPTNKEIQRAIFRSEGVYDAISKAKDHAKELDREENWRNYLFIYIKRDKLEEVTRESVRVMENALGNVTNKLLGQDIFDARPIEEWAQTFLPYASRLDPSVAVNFTP